MHAKFCTILSKILALQNTNNNLFPLRMVFTLLLHFLVNSILFFRNIYELSFINKEMYNFLMLFISEKAISCSIYDNIQIVKITNTFQIQNK